MEKCKQIDAFYEDVERRKSALIEKAFMQKDELFESINKKTGLNLNFIMEKRTTRNGDIVFNLESNEIRNPIIALAWKSFRVENFGGNCCYEGEGEEDYSKPASKVYYWMSIHYGYEHVDGGTNGAKIGNAYFFESTGHWQFKLYSEK